MTKRDSYEPGAFSWTDLTTTDAAGAKAFYSGLGAFFSVWQPDRHHGAGLVNAPGALTWNDLWTNDVEAASEFYRELFGWEIGKEGPYTLIRNGEDSNGGIQALTPAMQHVPPHWDVIFGTDNAEAAQAKVEELGGGVLVPVMEIGMGRVVAATDPQGAAFVIFEGTGPEE